jgi:hypothetical protein
MAANSGKILFKEIPGLYQVRTIVNIKQSDATLIIAINTSTPGEKLTISGCQKNEKPCMIIEIKTTKQNQLALKDEEKPDIKKWIMDKSIKTLNIAGNCLDKFPNWCTQEMIDTFVLDLLTPNIMTNEVENKVLAGKSILDKIQTGGQTGIDEAGAKAGAKLGIPTLVNAPGNWIFRDRTGKDIRSQPRFKARFKGLIKAAEIPKKIMISEDSEQEKIEKTEEEDGKKE